MKRICRFAAANLLFLLGLASSSLAQSTSFDVEVFLDDMDISGYFVADFTPASADVSTTGSGNLNPTLNLQVGKRYKFTYANAGNHPFEVLAKGADPTGDTALLSLAGTGTMESDTGVAWLEASSTSTSHFYFTLTPALHTAMQQGGRTPGYRCNFHPSSMRGSIAVSTSGVADWKKF